MFESLKQQPRGMTPRERTRLFLTLGAAAVLAAVIFGGGMRIFTSEAKVAVVAPLAGRAADPNRDLDLGPLAALVAGEVAPTTLDTDALRAKGTALGTGAIVVVGEPACPLVVAASVAGFFERLEQSADLRISERDLADIRIEVSRPEWLGRIVGAMRVVEVRPQEET